MSPFPWYHLEAETGTAGPFPELASSPVQDCEEDAGRALLELPPDTRFWTLIEVKLGHRLLRLQRPMDPGHATQGHVSKSVCGCGLGEFLRTQLPGRGYC